MLSQAVRMEMSGEWTAAREVQQRFMQDMGPVQSGPVTENLDVAARCRQKHELGGDFYDFVPLSGNRLTVAIGDASGKGLAAALMIANVQSSLRTAAHFTGSNPACAIQAVNRQVHGSSLAERYATLFYGVFNSQTRILHYVNAGHQPPMVLRRNGSVEWLEDGGAPVGLFQDWSYQEGVAQLYPGDVVIACTDGVTEAVNPAGEEWGVEGLRISASACSGRSAGYLADAILAGMDDFSRGFQSDDAAVVVLRVH